MKPLSRRSMIAGSAATVTAIPTLGLPVAATEGDDAELRCLWGKWVETWTALQEAEQKAQGLRIAVFKEKKRLPKVYYLDDIRPANSRTRRRWVVMEGWHTLCPQPSSAKLWRVRPIPGLMSYSAAYDFAKERLSVEMAAHRRRCEAIRARHGLDALEAKTAALREHLDKLRKAIKATPASTIFGVGVRMVANEQWEDDRHETYFSTLETVEKLSGTQFRLPELRV